MGAHITEGGPFREVFTRVRETKGLSLRNVADLLGRHGAPLSPSHLGNLERGETIPNVDVMRTVAEVLDLDPLVFAEYRLAIGRTWLDERGPQGLEIALARLERFAAADPELAAELERPTVTVAAETGGRRRRQPFGR